ncbi:MAG: hypothetical protein ACFCVK_13645 [Acidimicrobiales bacterium]
MSTEEIQMVVPAAGRHVKAVRLVAATLAADLGFDVEELEDVRVGVSELCSLLQPEGHRDGDGDAGIIELRLIVGPAGLEVGGRYVGRYPIREADWLVEEILTTAADDFDLPTAADPSFHFVRRRVGR